MTTDVMTSGPWPEPAIVDTNTIALAVIRFEGMRIEGLPAAFDASYGPVMAALQGFTAQALLESVASWFGYMVGLLLLRWAKVGQLTDRK